MESASLKVKKEESSNNPVNTAASADITENAKLEDFRQMVKAAAEKFSQIDKSETIRLVSHLDADGLSSASIMVKTLLRENRKYCLSIVHQLTEEVATQLVAESYSYYVFTDLGTGQFDILKKNLSDNGKSLFILDHHHLQKEFAAENIVHVNPHLAGIESSREISGAGVAYLFSKALNGKNTDLAHLAIIGAIGDMQEDKGFSSLNREMLADAKSAKMLKVITGLRLFGVQTKPLHKVLGQSSEFQIPGVTGSESAAIQFLQQLGINPKSNSGNGNSNGNSGWRKLTDLNDEELVKLATGVVLQRINLESPEAIIGPVYILRQEADGSPLRDAREFATLLNACGRLEKASVGIGACIGDQRCKEEALSILDDYKQQIASSLTWYEGMLRQRSSAAANAKSSEKPTGSIIMDKSFVIINAEDNVLPTMIGTLASIVSKSSSFSPGTFVLSLARAPDNFTKISLRLAGEKEFKGEFNLMEILTVIAGKVGGQAGGHHEAAGAIIMTEKEDEFIAAAKHHLSAARMEEKLTP
ncbi:DHH family phosphoesterase [Candidatus Woesearchaeota archaeon]|nr:DHH family phosphoesterase [Candidatus Woesearchaeota archaeon]